MSEGRPLTPRMFGELKVAVSGQRLLPLGLATAVTLFAALFATSHLVCPPILRFVTGSNSTARVRERWRKTDLTSGDLHKRGMQRKQLRSIGRRVFSVDSRCKPCTNNIQCTNDLETCI